MRAPRPSLALAVGLLLVALPDVAAACAACTGGDRPAVRQAFLWTTGFLTVLPLALLGGILWWLRRRARSVQGECVHGEWDGRGRRVEVLAPPAKLV